ncbi:hypothetical protein SBA6_1260003 [Candidatus Sulfopaludibacter sp. SbA6]|nr:hypothetical protein SBA6_1260003 [Candidatus Sulfopaludibacter sp. SbA6]
MGVSWIPDRDPVPCLRDASEEECNRGCGQVSLGFAHIPELRLSAYFDYKRFASGLSMAQRSVSKLSSPARANVIQ